MLDFFKAVFLVEGSQGGVAAGEHRSPPLSELMLATVRLKIVGRVRKIYEQLNNTKKKVKNRCV